MSDHKHGIWKKNRADRAIFLRGRMYYIRYADGDGKLHVERAGPSKAVALKRYQQRKNAVDEGRFDPAQARRAALFDEIVKDAVTRDREAYEIKHPGQKFYEGRHKIILGWFAGRKARSITPQEIAERLSARCQNQSAATRNHLRGVLSRTFKIAVENKKVSENPATPVKKLRLNNERVRYLNQHRPDEERLLREVIRKHWPEREPEIDFALNTGLREGEVYDRQGHPMLWEHVDLLRNRITIPRGKSGRKETIPINVVAARALAKLRALAPKSATVCPDPSDGNRRKFWDAAIEAAGIVDFHWHDLRHTFASRLVMADVSILVVKELMRHQTLGVTLRYAHLAPSKLDEAVAKLQPFSDTDGVTAAVEAAAPATPTIQ